MRVPSAKNLLSLHQASLNTYTQDLLEKLFKNFFAKPPSSLGNHRMIRNCLTKVIAQIPVKGEVYGAFLGQPSFQGDAKKISDEHHLK